MLTSKHQPSDGGSGKRSLLAFVLRTALIVLVLILAGAALAALAVRAGVSYAGLQGWLEAAHSVKRWGLLVQCLFLASIVIWWPSVVAWGKQKGYVAAHEFAQVLRLRWGVLAFGLAYLLLVPIGPTTLWRFFGLA